jgi:hypothetical protein
MTKCPICGTLESPVTKFNNGNPTVVTLPNCDCQTESVVERFFARLREQQYNQAEGKAQ